jgi:tetratricopeptide (TPR) repeat protein
VPAAGAGPQRDQVEEVEEEMSADISTKEGLFAVMRQVAAEREAAKPMVAELMAREELPWDEEIPEEWRTVGFVEELTKAAAAILEQSPTRCIEHLTMAFAIQSSISNESSARTLAALVKGSLTKELALATRYVDSYRVAEPLYERAAYVQRQHASLAYELALTRFSYAGLLVYTDRVDTASAIVENVETVFQELGDEKRLIRCHILKGCICAWSDDFRGAIVSLREVLPRINRPEMLQTADDIHALGVVHNTLGVSHLRLGEFGHAAEALSRAREIFAGLEMLGEVDRADWNLARILVATGEIQRAIPMLQRVSQSFLSRGQPEAAGLTRLDLVEAFIACESRDAALRVTYEVLEIFTTAELNKRALTALAYLHDLLPMTTKPKDVIRKVRTYVEQLRLEPDLAFDSSDDETH